MHSNCNNLYQECLHNAIAQNSLRKLQHLLNQPDTNLNCRNALGETPLFTSLRVNLADNFILSLLEAGCDVNCKNRKSLTPLHWASTRSTIPIARELIKRGTNINAQDDEKNTAIHYAVRHANTPLIHLLLYYGAGIHVVNIHHVSPLRAALDLPDKTIFETLLSFSKFSCLAMHRQNILRKAGASSVSNHSNFPPVYYTFSDNDTRLFKQIWFGLNPQVFLDNAIPFLLMFLRSCSFPMSEWLEVLNVILTSPIALQLVEDFRKCKNCRRWKYAFMSELLAALHRRGVEPKDRLPVLSVCINMGVTVGITEINSALHRYGFCADVEAFISAGDFSIRKNYALDRLFPLTVFVLALEEPGKDFLLRMFENQIRLTYDIKDVVKTLGYFSLTPFMKHVIEELCREYFGNSQEKIKGALHRIPEMPSLLELSRNKVRRVIKDNYKIRTPYQFHNSVNRLQVPRRVKDILRFKTRLY